MSDAASEELIVQEASQRHRHRVDVGRVDDEAGVTVLHRLGQPAAHAGDDGEAAGARLGESHAEAFHPAHVGTARNAEVHLRCVVQRGEVSVRHVAREAHDVADAQLVGEPAVLLSFLSLSDHQVVQVEAAAAGRGHGAQGHVNALVGLQSRHGHRPAVAVEAVAGAHFAGVEPRLELLGVGPQRHDLHVLGERIEAQLAQHLLRLLAGPLAVGDDRYGGAEQCLRAAPRAT